MDPVKAINQAGFTRLVGKENWAQWKSDVQIVLELNDSWPYVCGQKSLPTDEKARQAVNDALKIATYCLKMTCDNANRLIIGDKMDATAIYRVLSSTYDGDTPARRMALRRQLYHLEHNPSQPISVFLTTIRSLTTELASIGHALKPDEIRDIILMNLHPSFEVITTILASLEKNGMEEWTIDSLGTRLSGFEESRAVSNPESTLPAALAASHLSRRHRPRSPANDNWQNKQSIPGACDRCGYKGHVAACCFRDMPESVKDQLHSRNFASASANAVTVSAVTPLTIRNLLSTVSDGYTISLYQDKGFISRGDDTIRQIIFRDNNMFSESYSDSFGHFGS